MSPGKKNSELEFTGRVYDGDFAAGSKSAHRAIYIETMKGTFVLRRKGANPFHDPELQKLVGKTVTVQGTIQGYIFMTTAIRENTE